MKITETVTRECCEPKDLKPYRGMNTKWRLANVCFCVHCGEPWVTEDEGMMPLAEWEGRGC